jgi:FixJ family two-component response regulator
LRSAWRIGPRSNIQVENGWLESAACALERGVFSHSTFKRRKAGFTIKAKPVIAIVDDDPSVCRAIKRLVRSVGMDAHTFASGQEFVELIESKPSRVVDCVVLDIQMPGLNGLEVQERIKRSGSRIPIIFITAHDEMNVRDKALAAGAAAFVRKPFNDELLIKYLRAALHHGDVAEGQG